MHLTFSPLFGRRPAAPTGAAPGRAGHPATPLAAPTGAGISPTRMARWRPAAAALLLGAASLLHPGAALAQPALTSSTPARNAVAGSRTANVSLVFNTTLTGSTAGNVRLFSGQRNGQLVRNGNATASINTLIVNPAADLRPGETIFVTVPNTVTGVGGPAVKRVFQFTAAAGAGPGTFGGTTNVSVGSSPQGVATADVDGDGDLDLLTANFSSNNVSVRLNDGSGAFSGTTNVAVGLSPSGVTAADVDGDGDLDILAANQSSSTVSVRLNDGSGAFSGTTNVNVGTNPLSVVAADVDGDGDLDILTANNAAATVSVRFNNGSGAFSGSTNVAVGNQPLSVVTADVDGDGDLDILAANFDSGANSVSVRLNDGSGAFSGTTNVGVGNQPASVAAADVDSDGDLDLLTANFGSNSVSVRLNNGSGTFSLSPSVSVGTNPYSVAVADVDGDGDLDLLTANIGSDDVSVRLNNGGGAFSGTTDVATGAGSSPASVAAADVDGDGDLDILTTNGGSRVSVRFNQPPAPTLTSLSPTSGAVGSTISLTGTNLTGATAITFAGTSGNVVTTGFSVNGAATSITGVVVPSGAQTGNVTVTTPGGTSGGVNFTVSPPLLLTGSTPARNAVAGSRTADPTLTFSQNLNSSTAANVRVFSAQRGGQLITPATSSVGSTLTVSLDSPFRPGETVQVTVPATVRSSSGVPATRQVYQFTAAAGAGPGTFSGTGNVSVGTEPYSVAAADVDGDGDLDLLAANSGSAANSVSVRLNNGSGAFSGSTDVGVGTNPYSVTAADVDGDGDLDLLAANYSSGNVSVRLNNGSGTFSGSTNVSMDGTPYSVVAADLDGDGDLDLLSANNFSNNVSVRFNNGSGTFSGSTNVAVGTRPQSVAVADVDGDGDLDILTANVLSDNISVRLNDGSGVFSGTTNVAVGNQPRSVAAADVDGDGDLDLLAANSGSAANSVSVRLNNGSGTFSGSTDVVVGSFPQQVVAADVDGDGDLDLITSNAASTNVSVRLNNGSGTFSGTTTVGVGAIPRSVAAADVDGDGDLDLLTANAGDATVSVRFNQLPAPTLTTLTPASGPVGTTISLTGTNLTGATAITFTGTTGNVVTSGFTVASATSITGVVIPSGAQTGIVTVTTPGGTSGGVNFTVLVPPTLTSLSPSTAPVGTSITLTGTDFTGATGVSFNGTAASTFSVTNATTATVTVPAGATSGNVTITTPGGTSNGVPFTVGLADLVVSTAQTASGNYNNVTVLSGGFLTLRSVLNVAGTLRVEDGGALLLDRSARVDGTGNFEVQAGGRLAVTDVGGISASGPTGAVQVTGTRSFASDASYEFRDPRTNGVTGTGLPATVRELIITGSSDGITLTQPTAVARVLRLNRGIFNTQNQLTLLSTATQQAYAVHAGGTTNGTVTVQRFIGGPTAAGYRHLSSPVAATTVADLATPGFVPQVNAAYNALPYVAPPLHQFPNVLGFDETRGGTANAYTAFAVGYYSPTALTAALTSGRGWSVYMTGNRTPDFVGTLTTGNVAHSLTVTGTNPSPNTRKAGWHLLGNPYPQPIDWDMATVPTGMDAAISVYRTTGGNNGAYLTRANGIGSLPDGVLPVGQAFFARATTATNFTFTNALRVEANPGPVARPTAETRPVLSLRLTDPRHGTADETFVYVEAGATTGEDARFDGLKPGRNAGVPTLATLIAGASEAAVNGLPESVLTQPTTVELVAVLPTAGTYTLRVGQLLNLGGVRVELLDRLAGAAYDLAINPALHLRATRTNEEIRGRFALVFNGQRVTGDNSSSLIPHSSFTLFPNPATGGVEVRVQGVATGEMVRLLDATGRVVRTSATAVLNTRELAAGVYIVRTASGRTTRLVIE